MPDVFSKTKRSEVMSRIRSRGNRDTELALAKLLRVNHITGWRRHIQVRIANCGLRKNGAHGVTRPTFRVKPDFVFRQVRLALFVDGCFWHGCPKHATWPAHRAAWWRRKIEGNQTRDRLVNRALRRAGWKVVRIWEHELAKAEGPRKRLRLTRWGTSNNQHSTSNIQCRQTGAADPAGA